MKKYSVKFWIIFWAVSAVLLVSFYLFLQIKNKGIGTVADYLPVGQEKRDELKTVAALANYFMQKDGVERTYLILLQNNLEIRPGGGYMGSFGIVKIKNGEVSLLQIHDTSNFDARIPDTVQPPYPMKETVHINSWKMRDSNYSPDFQVNAQKAEEFYYMGQGQEKFDGVIGVTSNVLTSFLKITGPIQLEGYPGTYGDENAILALEYQVEKAYVDQGIPLGDRKSVMNELAKIIMSKVFTLDNAQKLQLLEIVFDDLNKKDIQLNFQDSKLQDLVSGSGWGGLVDENWDKDYLMLVDANLGGRKSDYYVKRSIDYSVDLTGDVPKAVLKITYDHTALQKDWMINNYIDYLRVYAQDGSWLTNQINVGQPHFGTDLGKKSFGFLINVPVGQNKTIELQYSLPASIKDNYNLKIQKQAGINDMPVAVHIINNDGKKDYNFILNSDFILNK